MWPGELLNGRVYNQEYHTVMTVREGRIVAVREYLEAASAPVAAQ